MKKFYKYVTAKSKFCKIAKKELPVVCVIYIFNLIACHVDMLGQL